MERDIHGVMCIRTVEIPQGKRGAFFQWIKDAEPLRRRFGCIFERVLEPSDGEGETLYVTVWKSHELFDAWIPTREHDELTASEGHQMVKWGKIKRYDLVAGYGLPELEE